MTFPHAFPLLAAHTSLLYKLFAGELRGWALLAGAVAAIALLWAVGRVPLRYNLRNLAIRWKTSFMTAMAFTLVIAILTVMLAFVNGMRRLTDGTGRPGNVIVLSDGSTDEVFSNLAVGDLSEIENLPNVLRDAKGRPMASRETYMVVNQPLINPRPGGPKRRFLQNRGVDDPLITAAVHDIELLPGGRWFSEAGVMYLPAKASDKGESTEKTPPSLNGQADAGKGRPVIEAVLGEGIARQLGRDRTPEQLAAARNPDQLEVGDTFTLGEGEWIVVGIMRSAGSTFNSEIWAKRSRIASMFGKETYTTLVMRTPDAKTATAFKQFLQHDYKRAAVLVQVETEYYASLSDTNRQFLWAIIFVTIVMAIGGVFGVMNTMFAAIAQRIKDIGVLRLLGFSRWQILVSFLMESLTIALLGGALGCALGSLADGWTATSMVSGGQGGGKFVVLQLAVDAPILTAGMLITLAMGFWGGLIPSLAAMRLKPLDALR